MEFFNKARVIRLRSHHDKYLVANDDEITVRQSRNSGSSRKARWMVELVEGKSHVIRLKSCHNKYLTASNEAFLLGMTGKKVVQSFLAKKMDSCVEWEPIKDGFFVKLRTRERGNFLRANGGTPPWRNSVTHDVPHRTATQDWVLWSVDVIDISVLESYESLPSHDLSPRTSFTLSPAMSFTSSPASSFSSSQASRFSLPGPDDDVPDSDNCSLSIVSNRSKLSSCRKSGMEFFDRAKAVRLRSHLGKYLVADDDEHTVRQSRNGSSNKARWTVEFVQGKSHIIRLKSCHNLYLTASDDQFLLGMTGKKVVQTIPSSKSDTSIEWEPFKEGLNVKLGTLEGKFLRANGGTPPWRNSITHDVPHRTATQDWVLWGVDVVDISLLESEPLSRNVSSMSSFSSSSDDFSGSPDDGLPLILVSDKCGHASRRESSHSFGGSPVKSEGRIIYYNVVGDDGKVNDAIEGPSFNFKGHGLEELTEKLEEETGLEDIIVCSRNPLNGKLYPLRLHLPPNNVTMNVVVVPASSEAAKEFWPETHNST